MKWQFEEAFLEPLARWFRFNIGFDYLPQERSLEIADIGCGPAIRFYKYALNKKIKIKTYYGVDPLVQKKAKGISDHNKYIQLVNKPLVKKIYLPNQSVDVVTMFAVLEHVDYPGELLTDGLRILKPGGVLILTTPTPLAKGVLEFLSFKLGLISKREIAEHQRYFTKRDLMSLLPTNFKRKNITHRYFELGLNNLLVLQK